MRVDHRLLGWGVFFITLGAVPLAVRANLVDSDTILQAWRLWPLVLIGAGVGIILRGTRVAVVGSLIVALTFGLLGGGVLAGGSFDLGAVACGSDTATGPTTSRTGTFSATATVELDTRCGDLNVRTVPGTDWSFTGVSSASHVPQISAASDELRVDSGGDHTFFPGFSGQRERWDVALPDASTLDLAATVNAGEGVFALATGMFSTVDVTVNAGSARMDLGNAQVTVVNVTVNAGDARIVLPDRSINGEFTVNAGSIRFCAPADVAFRIDTKENIAAAYDFADSGLLKDGSTWTSPNYGSAPARIDLSATANAGSIALNPKDGCR